MDRSIAPLVRIETVAGSRPDITIIRVHGPLEITNYKEFDETTRRMEAGVLIVDLADVQYIDSAVLGSMVAVHISCVRNQRKYALVNANQRITNMLTVSGVRDVIVTFATLAEAEAAL